MTRPRSTLAVLQQITTLGLAAGAVGWLAWHWHGSPWLAAAGFALIAFGYSAFLALEFVALRFVNRSDPVPQAGWSELARAWLAETLQAPRVFCWRQPFRWDAVPDRLAPEPRLLGRHGVVFIHGFVCNRGFWTPWLERLEATDHAFAAVNLEPVFGSIDDYVATIEQAVAAVTRVSGLPPILVCHSMGGLAARAWLRAAGAPDRVRHIVTIAAPHHGTWMGRFASIRNGKQMGLGSAWVRALEADGSNRPESPFTCWYSNCDNVVFPSSTATRPGADNRLVRGIAHVDLAFHPEVMDTTLALLRR